MSKKELINSGKFRLNFSEDQLTTKNFLHETLGEDFRKLIDEAYLFNDEYRINALNKLAIEQLKYAE
jgi:hypothetical protein